MSWSIRSSRESDRDAIRQVTLAAYEEYAPVLGSPHWEEYRNNILSALAVINPDEQIVAEDGGKILGTVMLYPQHTVEEPDGETRVEAPYARLLAVAPSARGKGVGRALMQECLRRARQSGADAVELHTMSMMHSAMRLYERMGFVHIPETDFAPAPGWVVKGYRFNLANG